MKLLVSLLIPLLVFLTALPSWAALALVGQKVSGGAGQTGAPIDFSLTNISGGLDTLPSAGDIVIATWCVNAGSDRALILSDTSDAPYTLLGAELFGNDANATNMRTGYKVMGGTPDTQVRVSESVAGGTGDVQWAGSLHVIVLRGQHATPLEQAVQEGTATNTHIMNPGSITPTTAGTWVVVTGCGSSALGAVYTSSDLTDFRSQSNPDTFDSMIGGGYLAWASGAFAPATWGGGGTDSVNNSYAWKIIAIAPAVTSSGVGVSGCGAAMMLLGKGAGC